MTAPQAQTLAAPLAAPARAVAKPRWRAWLVKAHKVLGLVAATLWLFQAVSGVFLSFECEASDAAGGGGHIATDYAALDHHARTLAAEKPGGRVTWVWTSAGLADRYVVAIEHGQGQTEKVRVLGDGTLVQRGGTGLAGFAEWLLRMHKALTLGPAGVWIMGLSGILLATNIMAGLYIAWPRRGWWRQALKPLGKGPKSARLYSWHRAVGFWAAIPGLLLAGTGAALEFEHGLRDLVGAPEVELAPIAATGAPVGLARAAGAALAAVPGSHFVAAVYPGPSDASYRVWLRAPGEWNRRYGASLVVVDANNGAVRGAWPLPRQSLAYRFMGTLYPLHTGESTGVIGRVLVLMTGLWLAVVSVAGVWLYAVRRRPKARKAR